jgi:hypothetical protein
MATAKTETPSVLADFRKVAARKVQYTPATGAVRAEVPQLRLRDDMPAPIVTRGIHDRTQAPVLMLVNGDSTTAMPLIAVGQAIASGVLSTAEVVALLGCPEDKAEKLAPAVQKLIAEARA